jgi:hypothetical protein
MTALDHLQNPNSRIHPNCACLGCILRRKTRYEATQHKAQQAQLHAFNVRIGTTLKALRGEIPLRALGLAAGVSAPFLSECENGTRSMTPETAVKILKAIEHLNER